MILWTIQPDTMWIELQKNRTLQTDTTLLKENQGELWKWTREPYEWMAQQMSKRIAPRPAVDAYPLWGWVQFQNERKKRPDLRNGGFLPKGTKGVRLEIEIDESELLLSDFHLWHLPLNGRFLALTAKQERSWDKQLAARGISYHSGGGSLPEDLRQQLYRSWEYVFELDNSNRYWELGARSQRSIQATFWSLSFDQVRKVKHFIAR